MLHRGRRRREAGCLALSCAHAGRARPPCKCAVWRALAMTQTTPGLALCMSRRGPSLRHSWRGSSSSSSGQQQQEQLRQAELPRACGCVVACAACCAFACSGAAAAAVAAAAAAARRRGCVTRHCSSRNNASGHFMRITMCLTDSDTEVLCACCNQRPVIEITGL
jgi:hypothetical protein